ncbi:MAG: hypothetical protein KBD55_00725 [Candidatus Pacebacteria bacterium]|nr:hypothetical protein [Candidatus Paceibacterota bacterium]
MKNIKEIKLNKQRINSFKKVQRIIKELEDGLDPVVLGRQVLIKGENKRIFTDYVLKIREKMGAQSKIEEEFLKTYIFSGWKLRRFREIERNIFNSQQKFQEWDEIESFNDSWGPESRRRIRNLSKVKITDEIRENNLTQEKLKKEMIKALKQLREEQDFGLSKK